MAITATVSARSCAVWREEAERKAVETRRNSWSTRGLICSAHSIWLAVPVIMRSLLASLKTPRR